MKFKYRCIDCKHRFKADGSATCPKCSSLYVKWLNYEQIQKEVDAADALGVVPSYTLDTKI